MLLAAVSPDGRKMIAVGDSNQIQMYDISSASGYKKVHTLTTMSDAGFSATWNHTSDKFAVATQDGYICVWDVRSNEKYAVINSKQNPQVKGACRNVKFSQGGSVDLLMFSEHVSYVSLVDARDFNSIQSIRVAPSHSDQHVSGISFSPDSSSIFVGMEGHLLEYNINIMSRRTFPQGKIR